MQCLRVAAVALMVRTANLALAFLLDGLLLDYDTSSMLDVDGDSLPHPSDSGIEVLSKGLAVWDSVYYSEIAVNGYEYEHTYAFFPFLPVPRTKAQHRHSKAGLFTSLMSFVVSACLMFNLSKQVLKDKRMASLATLLYCWTPASIFHTAYYTESIFGMMTLSGVSLLQISKRFWIACLCFAAASFTRSNGIINCGFILHSCACEVVASYMRSKALCVRAVAKALAGCAIVVAPFVAFQAVGHHQFCKSDAWKAHPRPWCQGRLPYMYGFVQSHYWGVGLFRYYQVKQIPNFLLAGPILFLSARGVACYAAHDLRFFSLGGIVPRSSPRTTVREAPMHPSKEAATNAVEFQGFDEVHPQALERAAEPAQRVLGRSDDGAVSSGAHRRRGPKSSVDPGEQLGKGRDTSGLASDAGESCTAKGLGRAPEVPDSLGYFEPAAAVFVFHWLFLALVAATAMHVQVATRFLSNSPALYWWMAHLCNQHRGHQYWLWFYCFTFTLVGTLMFANFYPWT